MRSASSARQVLIPRLKLLEATQKGQIEDDNDLLTIFSLYPDLIESGFQKGGVEDPNLAIIHCKDLESRDVFIKVTLSPVNLRWGKGIIRDILEFISREISQNIKEGRVDPSFRFFLVAPRYSRKFVSGIKNNPVKLGIELGYWQMAKIDKLNSPIPNQTPLTESETSITHKFGRNEMGLDDEISSVLAQFQTEVYFMNPISRKILAFCLKYGFINENKPPSGFSILSLEYEWAKQQLQRQGFISLYEEYIVRSSIIGYIRRHRLLVQYSDEDLRVFLKSLIEFGQ